MPLRIFGKSALRFPGMALVFFSSVTQRTGAEPGVWHRVT